MDLVNIAAMGVLPEFNLGYKGGKIRRVREVPAAPNANGAGNRRAVPLYAVILPLGSLEVDNL